MKKRYSQNHCCSLFLIPHKLIQLDLIQIEMWPSTPSNIHAQSRLSRPLVLPLHQTALFGRFDPTTVCWLITHT